jgi:hypothetical protein
MDQDILYIHNGSYFGEDKVVDMGLPICEQYCKIFKKKPFCLEQTLKEKKKKNLRMGPSKSSTKVPHLYIYLFDK